MFKFETKLIINISFTLNLYLFAKIVMKIFKKCNMLLFPKFEITVNCDHCCWFVIHYSCNHSRRCWGHQAYRLSKTRDHSSCFGRKANPNYLSLTKNGSYSMLSTGRLVKMQWTIIMILMANNICFIFCDYIFLTPMSGLDLKNKT